MEADETIVNPMAVIESEPEESTKDGDIFHNTGIKLQIIVQIASIYLATTVCWEFFITVFTGEGAGWQCVDNYRSPFCKLNHNITFTIDNKEFDHRCKLNRSEWTYNVPKTYSFVTEFDLVCDKTSIAALVSSAYYIGGFAGSFLAGIISDQFGRKPVLIVTILGVVASAIGGSYAPNVWILFAMNIVVGAASVGCFVTVYVYQLEYVTPSFRAISGALMQLSITMAGCFIDLISYYVRYWRSLKMYTALPCALTLLVIIVAPESPRWLLSTGKIEKAKEAMEKICKFNKKPYNDIQVKLPISDVIEKKYNYTHLFRHPKVLILTLCAGVVWFTVALVAYALIMVTANIGGNLHQTFILSALGNFPAFLIAPYVSTRFGRKKSTLVFLTATGILVGCMALVPLQSAYSYYIDLGIMIISNCLVGTTFTLLYTWSFEIWPTPIRSQGMSACVIFERIGVILVPFITRVLQQVSHILPYLIMCGLALLSSIAGLKLPETNNKPLREAYEDLFETRAHSKSTSFAFENIVVTPEEEKDETTESAANIFDGEEKGGIA